MIKKNKIGVILFSHEDSNEYQRALRFQQEIKQAGYIPELLYCDLFSVFYQQNKLEFCYNTKKFNLNQYKLFIPRYSLTNGNSFHRFSIARFLEQAGTIVMNRPEASALAKNKRDSLVKLAMAGLPIVPTGINYSQFFLDPHLKHNKKNRIIAKANSGSLGYKVSIFDSHISFISFMEFMAGIYDSSNILIQPYIESGSSDYRLIIVGNKLIAAMKRQAKGIEFRSNISKGGTGTKIKPSQKMINIAIKAKNILGLDYAGVDIIKSKNKLMILEVNSNPSLAIEQITDINVVKEIIKYGIKISNHNRAK